MRNEKVHLPRAAWLLLFVLIVLTCGAQQNPAAAKVITDADKGGTAHLKTGEMLEVRLKSNPSTGFMWYVTPKSTPLLRLVRQSQTEPTEPGVGRPIFHVFVFQAKREGDGVLLLHYVRSWEKPAADEQQFDLHVSIE